MKRSLILCYLAGAALAQNSQDGERRLWSTEFSAQRPSTPDIAKAAPSRARPPVNSAMVGVTLWRMRTAKTGDATRVLVHEKDAAEEELTPERVSVARGIREGDRVRVSIESARSGFLYVLSREEYRDGTLGEPYLIFPSKRILGGDNRVQAGRVVDIPEWNNPRPYLKVVRSRPDQVAEKLIILVAPQAIDGMISGGDLFPVPVRLVEEWQRKWGGEVKTLESPTEGQAMSPEEKSAAGGTTLLTGKDPAPQTLYRVSAPPNTSLLFSVAIRMVQ